MRSVIPFFLLTDTISISINIIQTRDSMYAITLSFIFVVCHKINGAFLLKTAILRFYCIISPHPRKLDINRAVGTSRSRYWVFWRHRCRRYGFREDLLLIQVVFTKKGADEAKRNRRWCRRLLPTKEKPLSYVGWAQDKGLIWKGGFGWIPLQCKIYFLFNLATLYSLRIIAMLAIILIYTRYYLKSATYRV